MRVYLNGRFLAQRTTGVQRVAAELVRALDRLWSTAADAPEATLLLPPAADPGALRLSAIRPRTVGRLGGYAWEQLELPRHAAEGCLLSFGNLGPLAHRRQGVLMHDASVFDRPAGYGLRFRIAQRALLPWVGRRARWLFAPSCWSATRLAANGVGTGRGFTVVANGSDHLDGIRPDPSAREAAGLRPGGYVLFVGSPHPNKNLAGARAALERLGRPGLVLAVVGARDAAVFAPDRGGRDGATVCLGAVDDAALAALYRDALCLLFPSYYEGFGLPPVEAMRLGCPVVASDRAAVPEACGGAALLVDPDDGPAMAAAIGRLADDPALRRSLVARGLARTAGLTWENAARRLWAAVTATPDGGPPDGGAPPASRASG